MRSHHHSYIPLIYLVPLLHRLLYLQTSPLRLRGSTRGNRWRNCYFSIMHALLLVYVSVSLLLLAGSTQAWIMLGCWCRAAVSKRSRFVNFKQSTIFFNGMVWLFIWVLGENNCFIIIGQADAAPSLLRTTLHITSSSYIYTTHKTNTWGKIHNLAQANQARRFSSKQGQYPDQGASYCRKHPGKCTPAQ